MSKKITEKDILKALESLVANGLAIEETINGEKKYSLTMLGVNFVKNLQTKTVN